MVVSQIRMPPYKRSVTADRRARVKLSVRKHEHLERALSVDAASVVGRKEETIQIVRAVSNCKK